MNKNKRDIGAIFSLLVVLLLVWVTPAISGINDLFYLAILISLPVGHHLYVTRFCLRNRSNALFRKVFNQSHTDDELSQ